MVAARSAISTCPAATAIPARPAAAALLHGLRADGRQVDTLLLSRLRRLDQDAAPVAVLDPADLAQLGAAGEHGVGPLGGLDGKHIALGHHGRLADIEAAERADHAEAGRRCRRGPRRRAPCRRASPRPPEAQAPRRRRHARGSPLPSKKRTTRDSTWSSPPMPRLTMKGKIADGAEVELDIGEIRPRHAADDDEIAAAFARRAPRTACRSRPI